jgi:Reverse transcriptase (RNA-dependent DNA polymerase)
MDVKSVFLNEFLDEKMYVLQSPGFVNQTYPNHVYRLTKALYSLKQTSRVWYGRLSSFLFSNGFILGQNYTTLFTKIKDSDLLLVQIYVDDIIFGSINFALPEEFFSLMYSEFKMSMMRELIFFLGLQIKQINDDIYQELKVINYVHQFNQCFFVFLSLKLSLKHPIHAH